MSDFVLTPPSVPHKGWTDEPTPLANTIDHKVNKFMERHNTLSSTFSHQAAPVPSTHQFVLANGQTIESLQNLRDILPTMTDELFSYHVTQQKNDFSNWVRDIMHQEVLATKLQYANTRQAMIATLDEQSHPESMHRLSSMRQQVLTLKARYDEKNDQLLQEMRKREAELYDLHQEIDTILQQLADVEEDIRA